MARQFSDHPQRLPANNELHARPFPILTAPCEATYVAFMRQNNDTQDGDISLLCDLLDRFSASHPATGANHFAGPVGRFHLKWERHSEFVTYTIFSDGLQPTPFHPDLFDVFPADWLVKAGVRVASAIVRTDVLVDEPVLPKVTPWFDSESLAISYVLDKAGVVASDFRLDSDGHSRIAMFIRPDTGPNRTGRIVQRLLEIETYKTLALLGLHAARGLSMPLGETESRLGDMVRHMSQKDWPPEDALAGLLDISAQLEAYMAETEYRFAATRAYSEIVAQRIEVLREEQFHGNQSLREFMMRRFDPAIRTVEATRTRLQGLALRAARSTELLRTRVDVDRSMQNQRILKSMDKRSDLQLRLQHTVEGLSVVAVSYYAVGLLGYLLGPVGSYTDLSKTLLLSALTLPVVGVIWVFLRRIHKHYGE